MRGTFGINVRTKPETASLPLIKILNILEKCVTNVYGNGLLYSEQQII
jgi:hypothetical protein